VPSVPRVWAVAHYPFFVAHPTVTFVTDSAAIRQTLNGRARTAKA